LGFFVAALGQSIFNLTQSLNDENFHVVGHVGFQDFLVDGLDYIIKRQRSLEF
jgi:hypothetical protein